jgi:uncharacterized protein YndB with AHSA1/START domain
MTRRHVLEIRRTFAAPPERVFEAFRDPTLLKAWAAPDEHRNERVEQDFRVGGSYRREMRFPDDSIHVLVGVFREIDPPRRLAYTYRWETLPMPETLVEIDLVETAGGTELRLVHSGFPDGDLAGGHDSGWQQCFHRLQGLLESHQAHGSA